MTLQLGAAGRLRAVFSRAQFAPLDSIHSWKHTKTKMPGFESEVLVRSVACLLVGQHEIK